MTKRALVLGGGGVAGIAWETGVLAGLADGGVDLRAAGRIIGTSAGATVAAQITSGLSWAELYRRQADPALQNKELPSGVPIEELMASLEGLFQREQDLPRLRKEMGRLALAADTVAEPVRREVIAGRLPRHEWPDADLAVVAVDTATGEHRVFDRDSGVDLVDAVAASCAVPGVWPPVTIGAARYTDGGVRSATNADLAAGADRVLILAPMEDPQLGGVVASLGGESRVTVVAPDEASLAAMGPDPLDPAVRTPAAEAGRAQGRALTERFLAFWG
ncbi:patatin-like phospholipase family protein [Sphaerisporangium perillae]|uniref:patatin-like phospholipase family protein n=1 Tax=Sphaerisporangium perillae TaxID=2935860 RepID=UPI00200FD130|nr:patatin-like phospholipase family protein [Sphaerisporangium perillae]